MDSKVNEAINKKLDLLKTPFWIEYCYVDDLNMILESYVKGFIFQHWTEIWMWHRTFPLQFIFPSH